MRRSKLAVISDVAALGMTPGRARDERPQLRAMVRKTGHRALDMNGTLTLSGGPGSLRAGPFLATPGTALAPGQAARSWSRSTGSSRPARGRRNCASAAAASSGRRTPFITFPAAGLGREVKARSSLAGRLILVGLAALAVPAFVALLVVVRCRRSRLSAR